VTRRVYTIEITIDSDEDVGDAIEHVLDAGELQDALVNAAEMSDSVGGPISIVSVVHASTQEIDA
jgi:hypothetical protein